MSLPKPAALLLCTLLAACGGTSRDDAREEAVDHVCERLEECDQVGEGSGRTYATRSDCQAQQGAFWTDQWPANLCEDRIDEEALEDCLQIIDATACGSGLGLLNALDTCSRERVCAGD